MDKVVKSNSSGLYAEKGSKFFSYLMPMDSKEDLGKLIDWVSEKHPKSRHICYAYRIMGTGIEEMSVDAGEPLHSAGDPILNQLRTKDLLNTIGVVARIYGGTKLGIPGLRRAYGNSILDAIENSVLTEFRDEKKIKLTYPYELEKTVHQIIQNYSGSSIEKSFDQNCAEVVSFESNLLDEVLNRFESLAYKGIQVNEIH